MPLLHIRWTWRSTPRVLLALVACVLSLAWPSRSAASCPVGQEIRVDNDIPGSGYSEQQPENWVSNSVASCHGSYRYLSHTVGDGTRTGKALWQPTITRAGWYRVVTSYRASENRTADADYVLRDDLGGVQRFSVDQRGSDCTRKELGEIYCAAGGSCRLILDGTDDGASDAADLTTFTLTRCEGASTPPPAPNACQGIADHPGFELCQASATHCAGVFTNGAGCQAFCAAAGAWCVARFGGEPGCQQESGDIACDASNGHQSDWCECELPPPPPPPDPDPPLPVTPPLADAGTPAVDAALPGDARVEPLADAGLQPAVDASLCVEVLDASAPAPNDPPPASDAGLAPADVDASARDADFCEDTGAGQNGGGTGPLRPQEIRLEAGGCAVLGPGHSGWCGLWIAPWFLLVRRRMRRA
ncbi:MAG: hypothetical protein ABIJ09_18390 [Pseudomonadota bacterium]